ncbi:uncharacterized protein LOC109799503 [Cajanus cajan]|uniref:uncharacterized protein LOC109799503 n=1 Tax=Cajanus cajan TaxID=3821 RepID=UPI00098D8FDE|nr:uncharacterized protein LOC109799503 [Cajanus cajan]
MLESRGVLIDWDCFRRVFLEKYFPDSVRYDKEAEFMRLHQGSLFVSEYDMRRGGQKRGPYDRPVQSQREAVSRGPRPATPQGGASSVRCYRCEGGHMVRDCSLPGNVCFRCGRPGHISRDCQTPPTSSGSALRPPRPTAAGRVFTLSGTEASTSSDLVKGKRKAAGEDVLFLFDSGAMHSFISGDCVKRLGLSVSSLHVDLSMSTLASVSVVTSEMCVRCPIEVSALSIETERVIAGIEIVSEFPEVFPDDVSGLPPRRDVEFSIDLVPGAGPVGTKQLQDPELLRTLGLLGTERATSF